MATVVLHPPPHTQSRKHRLLEYVKKKAAEDAAKAAKAKTEQIDKEIEAVFEQLVSDPESANETEPDSAPKPKAELAPIVNREQDEPKTWMKPENQPITDSPPAAKRQKVSDLPPQQREKLQSVVQQAAILNQQMQDATEQGIIVCEDADVAFEEVKAAVHKENSPAPEWNMKQSNKPDKKIVHITGDSSNLEYYYKDGKIIVDDLDLVDEKKEKIPVKEKKKSTRRASKKSANNSEESEDQAKPSTSDLSTSNSDNESVYSYDTFPRPSCVNPEYMVIGPNETHISKQNYKSIDWNLSAPIVTRKLLLHIFGREILSTHSLTGKPSPAFLNVNKPLKKPLDANKVADIIYIVTKKMDVKPKEVRLAITSKCADEQKMRKTRLSK